MMERDIIKQQGCSMPKVIAIDREEQFTPFFLEMPEHVSKNFDAKQEYLKQVGTKIREVFDQDDRELFELVFIADSLINQIDKKKKYTGEISKIIKKLEANEMAPSEVPEEFRAELIKEGIMVLTNDLYSEESLTMMVYKKGENGVVFEDPVSIGPGNKDETMKETVLSTVWNGYIHPTKGAAVLHMVNIGEEMKKND